MLTAHWASVANWTEDNMDLGDDEEFDDGDELLFRLFRFRELAGKGCSASEPNRCTRLGGEKR